jgi:hypothetical protein
VEFPGLLMSARMQMIRQCRYAKGARRHDNDPSKHQKMNIQFPYINRSIDRDTHKKKENEKKKEMHATRKTVIACALSATVHLERCGAVY